MKARCGAVHNYKSSKNITDNMLQSFSSTISTFNCEILVKDVLGQSADDDISFPPQNLLLDWSNCVLLSLCTLTCILEVIIHITLSVNVIMLNHVTDHWLA